MCAFYIGEFGFDFQCANVGQKCTNIVARKRLLLKVKEQMKRNLLIALLFVMFLSGCASTAKEYLKQHPDTPSDIKTCMLKGRSCVGMSEEQILATFVPPTLVKRKGECADVSNPFSANVAQTKCNNILSQDMWVYRTTAYNGYGSYDVIESYFFFENGKFVRHEQPVEKKARELKEGIEKHFQEHPDRLKLKQTVLAKKIVIGMNKDEVLFSWGEATDVNRTVNALGSSEQWVYGSEGRYSSANYLYFDGDILTSWQD